jgi:SPP1 family predicted phage head-tail adaptor
MAISGGIGSLRHLVTIQQAASSTSVRGGVSQTWSTHQRVWGSVEALSGSEGLAAMQRWGSVTTRIRIRYLSSVTPAHRVIYGSRTFDILAAVDPDGRRVEMHLMCVERNL